MLVTSKLFANQFVVLSPGLVTDLIFVIYKTCSMRKGNIKIFDFVCLSVGEFCNNKTLRLCAEQSYYLLWGVHTLRAFFTFLAFLAFNYLGHNWGYVINFDRNLYLNNFCTMIPEPAIVTVLYTTIQYAAAAALWTAVHSAHSVTGARPRARAPSL